jgi:SAM-dependent methyltransferase
MTVSFDPSAPYAERVDFFADQIQTPARRDLFARAMADVDWDRLDAVRRTYLGAPISRAKFLDVPYWTWLRLQIVDKLALDTRSPARILDIGCGCAHFGLLARALGHDYVGTDIAEPVYIAVCETLQIRRIQHRVERGKPLPDFGGPFDFVTAFDTWFHSMARPGAPGKLDWWGPADWTRVLVDLSQQMTAEGRFLFTPNRHVADDGTHFHDPAIYANFARLGSRPLVEGESQALDLLRADLVAALQSSAPTA